MCYKCYKFASLHAFSASNWRYHATKKVVAFNALPFQKAADQVNMPHIYQKCIFRDKEQERNAISWHDMKCRNAKSNFLDARNSAEYFQRYIGPKHPRSPPQEGVYMKTPSKACIGHR